MAAAIKSTDSPQRVCVYLKKEIPSLSDDILDCVITHKIDGETFLELNDEYLKEIAPRLGDRLKLKKLIQAAVCEKTVSVLYC